MIRKFLLSCILIGGMAASAEEPVVVTHVYGIRLDSNFMAFIFVYSDGKSRMFYDPKDIPLVKSLLDATPEDLKEGLRMESRCNRQTEGT